MESFHQIWEMDLYYDAPPHLRWSDSSNYTLYNILELYYEIKYLYKVVGLLFISSRAKSYRCNPSTQYLIKIAELILHIRNMCV